MQRATKKVEKKRLVRYKEGAEMYSMGMNKFQTLAKDAGAILKIDIPGAVKELFLIRKDFQRKGKYT